MTDEQRPGPSYFFCRIGAHLLDLIVCFGIFYLIGMVVAARVGGLGARGEFNVQGLAALEIIGVVAVACFGYFVLTEAFFSRTLGKMACQLKVVRDGEDSCGLIASLVRNLVRPVDAFFFYVVGLVMLLTSKKQQRLGDMAARTRVIVQRSLLFQVAGIVGMIVIVAGGIVGGLQVQSRARLSAQMSIQNVRFVEGETGPSVTRPYAPGADLYLTFDLFDIPLDDLGAMNTVVQFEPLDPAGRAIVAPVEVKVTDRPAEGAGRETPIHFHLTLPLYALGGDYAIRITAKDAVLGREATQSTTFNVMGPQVASNASFGVQEHAFVAEEDGPPLTEAVFAPGTKVRTKFNVVGFKVGPENRVGIRLDLAVLSESGEKLLDQPNVVNIDQKFFYLPLYLPITTYIDAPADIPVARYRIQYTVHDDVAGTQISLDQPFVIR